MRQPPSRIATLVLVDVAGDVLGRLPPLPVETSWWQDAGAVVRAARDRYGIDVTLLRLLATELPAAHGGAVTYLAEVDPTGLSRRAAADLRQWTGSLPEDPLRLPYARPGGPAADLTWADSVLATRGSPRTGAAEQVRTWNLSSLWRLPSVQGGAWLKVVPPFFAHEGRLLERLAGEAVPTLMGHDAARMLLAEIAGDDQYDADVPALLVMVDFLVDLQRRWLGRADELRTLGLPDWRGVALAAAIHRVVDRNSPTLMRADRGALEAFVDALPDRLAAIDACGLPDSLVHGDFHPGNFRGSEGHLILLDWGDSGIGHALLDQPAFLTRIDHGAVGIVQAHWHDAWRRAVPGSDPEHAARLLAPVAAARQAVIYQGFLDRIEVSERGYHQADVPDWLERTAEILRSETEPGR